MPYCLTSNVLSPIVMVTTFHVLACLSVSTSETVQSFGIGPNSTGDEMVPVQSQVTTPDGSLALTSLCAETFEKTAPFGCASTLLTAVSDCCLTCNSANELPSSPYVSSMRFCASLTP